MFFGALLSICLPYICSSALTRTAFSSDDDTLRKLSLLLFTAGHVGKLNRFNLLHSTDGRFSSRDEVSRQRQLHPETRASINRVSMEAAAAVTSKPSLTPGTYWRFTLDLQLPGSDAVQRIIATARFGEEKNIDPPQGRILVESSVPEGSLVAGEQSGRFKLFTPNKGGLWINILWNPKPHPLMTIELDLANEVKFSEGNSIPAGKLYVTVDHRYNPKDGETTLGEGDVVYKVPVKLKADPLGLATVTEYNEFPCGKARFTSSSNAW